MVIICVFPNTFGITNMHKTMLFFSVYILKNLPTSMILFCKEYVSSHQIRAFFISECLNNNDDSISKQLILIMLINLLLYFLFSAFRFLTLSLVRKII